MTIATLCVAAFLTAWSLGVSCEMTRIGRPFAALVAASIFFVFLSIAIGAGIQFTFRG